MLKIKLNKLEYFYICQASFIQKSIKNVFFAKKINDDHFIDVPEELADEIRDLCNEQLQIIGFDKKYELTPEGEILESLVDKFFIG